MDSLGLLKLSDKLNIPVYNFSTKNKKAFCVQDAIAIDFARIDTDRECKQLLSEELGHVICGALYPLYSCGNTLFQNNIKRQERKALDYSLKLQIPLNELQSAIKSCTDDYEIAERLDIDITTLNEALQYYRRKGAL
ncbi:MAG: hypothetical protein K2K80_03260 [Clostridia bacterium]|nr:hypothetical protein [Clostridia bacterium]